MIDEMLSQKEHVNFLCQKLSRSIFAIKRTVAIGTQNIASASCLFWEQHHIWCKFCCGVGVMLKLEESLILKEEVPRVMAGIESRTSFPSRKIQTEVSLFVLEAMLFSLSNGLLKNVEVHSQNTRFMLAASINLPFHHTKFYENKLTYKVS